jgi:NCS1 family nucleobase:cation symporter-1
MLLEDNYNAATRAGCFFCGLGFFVSQVQVNLAQNSISCGMDLASFYPKYIDVARGSVGMCIIAYVINPWRFVNTPGTFITVLGSFGMFVSPLAGINAVDFWLVRKRNWKVPDLYIGNKSSIYWYMGGVNLRAMAAWTLAVWPSFPGFISKTGGNIVVSTGWIRVFNVSWIVGFLGGGLVYYILCLVFPLPGQPFVSEEMRSDGMVEGVDVESKHSDVVELDAEKVKA